MLHPPAGLGDRVRRVLRLVSGGGAGEGDVDAEEAAGGFTG